VDSEISDIVLPSEDFALGGRWYRQGRPNSCSFIALIPLSRQLDSDDEKWLLKGFTPERKTHEPPQVERKVYKPQKKWVHPSRDRTWPVPETSPLPPKPDWIEGKVLDLINDLRNPLVRGSSGYNFYEYQLARQILCDIGDYENAFKALSLEIRIYWRVKAMMYR